MDISALLDVALFWLAWGLFVWLCSARLGGAVAAVVFGVGAVALFLLWPQVALSRWLLVGLLPLALACAVRGAAVWEFALNDPLRKKDAIYEGHIWRRVVVFVLGALLLGVCLWMFWRADANIYVVLAEDAAAIVGLVLMGLMTWLLMACAAGQLVFRVLIALIAPSGEARRAPLDQFFRVRVGKRRYQKMYYCVSFVGDPVVYRVSWRRFCRFVEERGCVYAYACCPGGPGLRFMRRAPQVVEDIPPARRLANREAFRLGTPKGVPARLALLMVGIMLCVGGVMVCFLLFLGFENALDRGLPVGTYILMATAALMLGILASVLAGRKIRQAQKADTRKPIFTKWMET